MGRLIGAPEPIAALNRVRLIECGEPLVDLRIELPNLLLLRDFSVPWVRSSVAVMLSNACTLLPSGYRLGLREAWRSPERQKFVYEFYFEKLRKEHPHWSYATLRRQTNRFYAPYDQPAPPGHSTGGAVDVWLLKGNEPCDLHGPGERFETAPTFKAGLPKPIVKLRRILYDAMIGAGFTNCRDEWWHYSYGDAAWAVRLDRKECIYGSIYPPLEEYIQQDQKFFKDFLERNKESS